MTTRSNDHELNIGGTIKSLEIMRDSAGKANYQIIEDIPAYQKPLEHTEKDWSGGHGKFWWDGKPVYYDGQSIDTTKYGVVTVGPAVGGDASATTTVRKFLDYCRADDGGSFTDDDADSRSGTASDMILLPAVPAANDAYYFGTAAANGVIAELYIKVGQAGAGTWTITWEYYKDAIDQWTALTGVSDGTNSFKTLGLSTVSWTAPASQTATTINSVSAYWIRARVSSYTSVTTQPLGTEAWAKIGNNELDTAATQLVWFGATSSLFIASTLRLYEYVSSICWERFRLASGSITDLCEFNATLYIAVGASVLWYYTTDGLTITQTDLTNAYASYFLAAPNKDGTATVLYAAKTSNEVRYTPNGKASGTTLTTPIYVGDTSSNITNIFLSGDNMMVGKTDGLWNIDSDGGTHPLLPELRSNRDTNNFKYIQEWHGNVYVSLGTGVGELSGMNTIDAMVGPLDRVEDIGKSGSVCGIAADRDFLYVTVDEGTYSHIYKGKRGDNGEWAWCPWLYLSTSTSSISLVTAGDAGVHRILYYGYSTYVNGANLYDDPVQPPESRSCAATAFIRFCPDFGTNPNWSKLYQTFVVNVSNLTATNSLTVKYRTATSGGMSTAYSAYATNGISEEEFTTSSVVGNVIQFELDFAVPTATSASPPYVSYFQAKGVEVPTTTRVHEVVYYLGASPSKAVKTLRDFLRGARTSTSLVKLADTRFKDGASVSNTSGYVWVVMEPGYPQEVEIIQEGNREPEIGMKCRWREINFTVS